MVLRKFLPIAAALALLVLPGAVQEAAMAAPLPGFNEGVAAYNARRYSQAVSYFSQALKVSPADPTAHYYLALAYQGLNQMTQARQHYAFVAQCGGNRALAAQASVALNNLGRYQPSRSGSSVPSGGSAAVSAGGGSQRINGRLKVMEFSTDW